jgi:hypothetical protein
MGAATVTRSRVEATETSSAPIRRRRRFLILWVAISLLAVLVWRATTAQGDAAARPVSPTSPAIESRYGVRLLGAYVTAAGGMIEIEYQVVDPARAASIHDDEISPVLEVRGVRFDTPGMVGHGHSKETPVAGRTGYVLLANSLGLLRVGDPVSIVVGELSLDGVILE